MKVLDYFRRYGVALLAAGVAVALWYFVLRSLDSNPYGMLLAGVVVAALYGGLGPGVLATAVCTAAAFLLYSKHGVPLDIFAILGLALTWLASPVRPAQEELKRQIVITRAMSEHISEGILMLSAHGRVTFANPAMQKMIGWSNAELRRKELFHVGKGSAYREDSPVPSDAIFRALHGQQVSSDHLLLRHKDGRSVTVSCRAFPVFQHGNQIGTVVACQDTTETRQEADSNREQHEQYRGLIEASPDAVVLTDHYGFILLSNNRAAEMYGYQGPDSMIGVKIEEVFDESSRALAAQDRLNVAQGGPAHTAEYLARHTDGTRFPIEVSTIAVRDREGKDAGVASFSRDVSGRKLAEERARSDQQRLTMQYAVTQLLVEPSSLDQMLWKWLQEVCTLAGWEIGVFWQVDAASNTLYCAELWSPTWLSVPGFSDMTRHMRPVPGADLPGRVWLNGEAIWVRDIGRESRFSRAPVATLEGVKAAICFPIRSASTIYGVCELMSCDARDPDPNTTDALCRMGRQLGLFIERTRAESRIDGALLDT